MQFETIFTLFAMQIKTPLMPRVVYSSSPIFTPIFPKITIAAVHVNMLVLYSYNFYTKTEKTAQKFVGHFTFFIKSVRVF